VIGTRDYARRNAAIESAVPDEDRK
jgi:hypothetical protein